MSTQTQTIKTTHPFIKEVNVGEQYELNNGNVIEFVSLIPDQDGITFFGVSQNHTNNQRDIVQYLYDLQHPHDAQSLSIFKKL